MKYIVYCTINKCNWKIYVGVHETENPDKFDGYLGNSINRFDINPELRHPKLPFHKAIKKYGYDSFERITLQIFDKLEDALKLEGEIVNESFLKRKDVYNICLGGGMPPLHNKEIYQYSLDGKCIAKYNSLVEAANAVNGFGNQIGQAALHKYISYNYYWSFEKYDLLDLSKYKNKQSIPVYIYDLNGEFIKEYKSMMDCVRDLNISLSNVQRAIGIGNKCKGYYISTILSNRFVKPKVEITTGLIHQYNLSGEYIKSYQDKDELPKGLDIYAINRSIKMNRTYGGYIWLRGEKRDSILPHENVSQIKRKVGQYTLDGKLIKIFNTVRECRKEFPNVSKVLSGRAKHCHGYTFKYIS